METFDIDKLIRNKLSESTNRHKEEMDSAKPFVWAAIREKVGKKRTITWYHLAAATVLLLGVFTYVLTVVQQAHQKEMNALAHKIEQLEKTHVLQRELIFAKETRVNTLQTELHQVAAELAQFRRKQPLVRASNVIYRTDTLYLKEVEYRAVASQRDDTPQKSAVPFDKEKQVERTTVPPDEQKKDDIIFPSRREAGHENQSEPLRVKLGAFAANKQ